MYESWLESEECCANHLLSSPGLRGTGIRYLPIDHEENRQQAPEEAEAIAREVKRLLDGGTVVDAQGRERALRLDDVLVVAPYNA
jgi:hypothetical protein